MLARLKAEAETRTAAKEAKQRTLVAIEVKPWDIEQDLVALWKKITTEVQQGAFILRSSKIPSSNFQRNQSCL